MAITVEGTPCTLGFLLEEAETDRRFAATAGHCVPGMDDRSAHDRVWDAESGPEVLDPDGNELGRVAFAALADDADIALIALDTTVLTISRVCAWHAPTTADSSTVKTGDAAQFYGQGVGVSHGAPGRSGVVSGASSPHSISLLLAGSPGDSGGPVLVDDIAAGILVAGGGTIQPDPGLIDVMRLDAMLDRAARAADLVLNLLAPSADDPSADSC